MVQTLIRASTQILAGSVTWALMAAGAIVPTGSLVDGANFIKRDGSVAMTASFNAGGFEITNSATPTAASSLATKNYVDAAINGLANRRVRLISTSNVALTALQTIDGIAGAATNRIWLNAQTTASQNGIWVMAAGAWSRPIDWAAASAQKSTQLYIEEGASFQDTKWIVAADAITVDTTSLTPASQDLSGVTYTNGAGLALAGSSFSVIYGTTANTAAQGNDSRITGALQTSALGGSVAAALAVAVGTAGSFVVNGGAGGTPSSLILSNATGLPLATGVTGTLASANMPAFTGDVTNVGLAMSINRTAGTGFLKYTDFVSGETPGGLVNGANTAFTIAVAPQVSSLELYLNGQQLEAGAGNDYTIAGTGITMLFTPQTGDKLRAWYIK